VTARGFKPEYFVAASMMQDDFKNEPALKSIYVISNSYPYVNVESPVLAEYAQALAAYGKDLTGIGPENGWLAGKLLERAGRALQQPTSQGILEGLWSITNDDLGGLTYPITFTKDQKQAPKVACWWYLKGQDGKWVTPDAYQRHCL